MFRVLQLVHQYVGYEPSGVSFNELCLNANSALPRLAFLFLILFPLPTPTPTQSVELCTRLQRSLTATMQSDYC